MCLQVQGRAMTCEAELTVFSFTFNFEQIICLLQMEYITFRYICPQFISDIALIQASRALLLISAQE